MKIKDMKFPIKFESKDSSCEYNIEFIGDTFFKKCCDEKSITGNVYSRNIHELIKGFSPKIGNAGFEYLGHFKFCPKCGEFKSAFFEEESVKDIILEAWLKIINKKRRYRR